LVLSPGIRFVLLNRLYATRELLTDIWNAACLFIDTPQPSTFNLHPSITDPRTDQNETSVNDKDDSSHDGSDSEDEFDDYCCYNDHSD
jgi:hypothetical protein